MASLNRMLRQQFPILVLIALGLLVWTQRKSFAKVAPGGGCGDDAAMAEAEAAEEDRKAAARGGRRRR